MTIRFRTNFGASDGRDFDLGSAYDEGARDALRWVLELLDDRTMSLPMCLSAVRLKLKDQP